jgi:Surface antigen variable number repeat
MRRLLSLAVMVVVCVSARLSPTQTQPDAQTRQYPIQPEEPCTSFPAREQQPHEVPVIGVSFSGNLQIPVADQEQIAADLKRRTYSEPLTGVSEELLVKVKSAWQDEGFVHVGVNGDAILTNRGPERGLALSVHINEGYRYRLGGISFQHNKALTNTKYLRSRFPIEDGEVFSGAKVAEGLSNLRKAYGEFGYLNYAGVPETKIDEARHQIYIVVDIGEGKQFLIDRVEVVGLADARRKAILQESALHRGDVYNARLDELFLGRIESRFPDCECSEVKHNQIDEQRGTVVLTYDLASCAAGK